ncbi:MULTISPECIES: hypothetical protein [Vibrio harveyi group]|uniref:hypothetical protein n=1 Tax=Vibrio harveyi group TaxID=717610 RepID=UPI0005ACBBF8|nr:MULTISPECIES: hypothetical protein [Vibrio harveyi group]EJG0750574.1 hypothetical protein [Vibrio parahaemolyticus]MEA3480832.1 hypothetical protein [Pseudomonadota bacterium]KIP75327.1 hypothetical protein SN12_00615 [Vibrio alginolyticus]KIP83983.1 hypothetical protein SN13_08830 [Vibrio alginolyticus]MCR9988742.1 hypothetical protein [Vibrio antiquarius]
MPTPISMDDLAGKVFALQAVLATLMKTVSVSNPEAYEEILKVVDANIERPENADVLVKGLKEFKEALDRIKVE